MKIIIPHLLQVYGNGKQTRSFQYISDLVDGLIALMNSNYTLPVNLGNPTEHTMLGLVLWNLFFFFLIFQL